MLVVCTLSHGNEEDLKAQRALQKDEQEAKKEKTETEEARQKRKLQKSELRNDLECINKILNYLRSC